MCPFLLQINNVFPKEENDNNTFIHFDKKPILAASKKILPFFSISPSLKTCPWTKVSASRKKWKSRKAFGVMKTSYKSRRKISAGLFLKSKKILRLFFFPLNFPVSETFWDKSTAWVNSGNLISPTGLWPDIINNRTTINSSWNPLPASFLQAPEHHFHCLFFNSPLEMRQLTPPALLEATE